MDTDEIPEEMSFVRPVLERLKHLSQDLSLTRQEIALGYIKSAIPNSRVVFGADNSEQVKKNLLCWNKKPSQYMVSQVKKLFDCIDESVLNPTLWPN